jgi:catechol 2,3-dioxygenase-like lactoylglutathione lyase family enzyme
MASLVQRFDHLVVAVRDLDAAVARWRHLGLDVQPGGRHPGVGTHNVIVRFGTDYLELLAVHDPAEARAGGLMAPLLSLLERREEALAGLCLASEEIDDLARRLAAAGLDYVGPTAMSRQRPDGRRLGWRLLLPRGGPWRCPLPFFIRWDEPDDVRLQWERPGEHPLGASAVAAVSLLVPDLAQALTLYHEVLGLPLEGEDGVPELAARRARLRLGECLLELLAPVAAGEAREELDALGPGPFRACLRVGDMATAAAYLSQRGGSLAPEPGLPGGQRLVSPGLGVRLALIQGPGGR